MIKDCPECPWCGCDDTWAEFVDIGVGYQQVTPYICGMCSAYEISSYCENYDKIPADERRVGWYRPCPQQCPHNYEDVGIGKPRYVCKICLDEIKDFTSASQGTQGAQECPPSTGSQQGCSC